MSAASAHIERILDCLPQTQCARCGYPGCRPYAEALAAGEALNRCPPGGETTIVALAAVLDRPVAALATDLEPAPPPALAFVREADCIGCFKCVRACPVDAIVGAPQLMHTVIAAECTGCGLCVPPCPVDCIELHPVASGQAMAWSPAQARQRFDARSERLARERRAESSQRKARRANAVREARIREVRAAIERVRARRRGATPDGSGTPGDGR